MRLGTALLVMGTALAASAQLNAAQSQSSTIARGESIVQEKCSRCHATGRTDASPNPKALPFREVGKLYPLDHLAEALAEGIITGDNDMPEFKFNPRDVDAIIEYLSAMSQTK